MHTTIPLDLTPRHYDALGLLRPTARTPGGDRVYGQADTMRLHAVPALKHFGCSLAAIRTLLDEGGTTLALTHVSSRSFTAEELATLRRSQGQAGERQAVWADSAMPWWTIQERRRTMPGLWPTGRTACARAA